MAFNYLDTDGKDVYFNNMQILTTKSKYNLLKNGILILENVTSLNLKKYYKSHFSKRSVNNNPIWKKELIKKGYTIELIKQPLSI